MTRSTTGRTVITGLIIGPKKPEMRIVQSGFSDIDHRHCNAASGTGPAVGLFKIGSAGFIEFLQLPGIVGQTDFRKLSINNATAAFKHTKNIARRYRFPGGQRSQTRQNSHGGHFRRYRHRIFHKRRLTVYRVGFAKNIAFERQNTVVVSRAAPEHGAGRHQAAFAGVDNRQMTGATSKPRDTQITGINKADIFRRFTI